MLDELRGEWIEASHHRRGALIDYGVVAGRSVEVSWLLAPEGGSQRCIDASEMETLDLGSFTVDTTKDPAWIDESLQTSVVRLAAWISIANACGDFMPPQTEQCNTPVS